MTRLRLAILIAACAVWALAVFVRMELETMATRICAWASSPWGQRDEAHG